MKPIASSDSNSVQTTTLPSHFQRASRHHDDRDIEPRAYISAYLDSVTPREHHIEQDEVEGFACGNAQRLLPVVNDLHVESCVLEVKPGEFSQAQVVFDQE
jgi:hypothetical protein